MKGSIKYLLKLKLAFLMSYSQWFTLDSIFQELKLLFTS
jgi:hypothetical protein